MKLKNKIGSNIALFIEKNKISISDFAVLVGISVSILKKIINGERDVKAEELYKICKKLKISANWLLGIEDPTESYWKSEYDDLCKRIIIEVRKSKGDI